MFRVSSSRARPGCFASSVAVVCVGCGGPPAEDARPATEPPRVTVPVAVEDAAPPPCAEPLPADEVSSLSDAFAAHFRVGVAVSGFTFQDAPSVELISTHFNHLSPENLLKWSSVHREPGVYNFEIADQYVAFGEERGMSLYGHALVWHQQVPEWVFLDDAGKAITKAALIERLSDHITTVAGRYGDRIEYWDVVNEAFNDDGSLRDTPWRSILGDDYIAEVFELTSTLIPDAKLVYNDYSLASSNKRAGVLQMVEDLQARGIRIDAIGEQGHYNRTYPSISQIDQMLGDFADLGIAVLITELDVDPLPNAQGIQGADLSVNEAYNEEYNPFQTCLPEDLDAELATRWQSLFEAFVERSDIIEAVTFWGVSDGQSWLNNWPVQGRTNYPLLFNRDLTAKLALKSVLDTANAP